MLKSVMLCAVAVGIFASSAAQPVSAFMPGHPEFANAVSASSNIIQVKRSLLKGHPPGWSHGRKVGWHRKGMPPGQLR